MPETSESASETVIESYLLAHGYVAVDRAGFDRERAIFSQTVLGFISRSTPLPAPDIGKEWDL